MLITCLQNQKEHISFSLKKNELDANTYSILNIIHNNIRIKIDVVLSEIRFQIGTIIKKCTIKNTDLNYWEVIFDITNLNLLNITKDGSVPAITNATGSLTGNDTFRILDNTLNSRCYFGNLTIFGED